MLEEHERKGIEHRAKQAAKKLKQTEEEEVWDYEIHFDALPALCIERILAFISDPQDLYNMAFQSNALVGFDVVEADDDVDATGDVVNEQHARLSNNGGIATAVMDTDPLVEKNGADSIKNVFILVVVSKLGNRRFHLWLVNYGGSHKIVTQEIMVANQPLSCMYPVHKKKMYL